jgi:DivIVA domain-containing protein
MALTPEEIEGRQFPVVSTGYDRDQVDRFLAEVALSYRVRGQVALPHESTSPAAPPPLPPPPPPPPIQTSGTSRGSAGTDRSDDSFDRLGDEVADILRSAQRLGESLRAAAETEAADRRAAAELEIAEAVQAAERDREQAKRVLVRAQERADAVVREAEEQAQERLTRANLEAEERSAQLLAHSRRHAEQVLRAERAAVERLRSVRADIESAITRLAGSETDPVVDLTSGEAVVRVGEMPGLDDDPAPGRATGDTPTTVVEPEDDPVQRLIRQAVERAAQHPVDTPAGDQPPTEPGSAGAPQVVQF